MVKMAGVWRWTRIPF